MKRINPFIQASEPVISIATKLQAEDRGKNLPENYQFLILQKLDQFKSSLKEQNIPTEKISSALYALTAFIDELVLLSEWAGKKQWMSQTLQWQLFQEHLAGEGFFKRLNILRQSGEAEADVLQLYYVCLQLGFQGKYRLLGVEHLNAYITDFKAQLTRYYPLQTTAISPQKYLEFSPHKLSFRQLSNWVFCGIFMLILLLIYSGFKFFDHHAAYQASYQIEQLMQNYSTGSQHV